MCILKSVKRFKEKAYHITSIGCLDLDSCNVIVISWMVGSSCCFVVMNTRRQGMCLWLLSSCHSMCLLLLPRRQWMWYLMVLLFSFTQYLLNATWFSIERYEGSSFSRSQLPNSPFLSLLYSFLLWLLHSKHDIVQDSIIHLFFFLSIRGIFLWMPYRNWEYRLLTWTTFSLELGMRTLLSVDSQFPFFPMLRYNSYHYKPEKGSIDGKLITEWNQEQESNYM